ncbi:Irregular chiasm C-roughest protein [Portunus trituberculatus]|uniref:Irregular chiasm C-roughest protein n=1 Tax=Portunus trituberculatus TaxID=210409 RepID=A0A5B7GYA0_PORTR|nr:Irregular chiasm C-roughest protein [Portunus trituberculatus]
MIATRPRSQVEMQRVGINTSDFDTPTRDADCMFAFMPRSTPYGPSFRVPPSDQYAEVGENVTLSCQVDSMPDPTIVWINQQTQTVAGTGSELRVSVSKNSVGVYQCIAKVEGFPEISDTVGVFLKGPPQVRSERIQWGKMGETVLVECLITSASTRSVTVTWTHNGQEVDLEEGRFEVTEDVTAQGLRHTLMVHKAQAKDFGPYNCSVQNAYGSDVFEIILNKKKTLPLLFIFCGVTGGIVFVLVAAVVVIMCAKRSAAKQKGECKTT